MLEVIPGILEQDPTKAIEKLELVKGFAKTVQIDILDGEFALNKTFSSFSFLKNYSANFLLEAHIMTVNPVDYIEVLTEVGFKRFIGQVEKMQDQEKFIQVGKKYGEVGLALDLDTEIESIKTLDKLDCVLLMSVKAGFSGQKFNQKVLDKIKKLKEIKKDIQVEVDGGVNEWTIKELRNAGADRIVVTSALFKGNPEAEYEKLRLSIN